jgi:hypothetical protein
MSKIPTRMSKIVSRWFVIDDAFNPNNAKFEIVNPNKDLPLYEEMSFVQRPSFLGEYTTLPKGKKGFQFLINNI